MSSQVYIFMLLTGKTTLFYLISIKVFMDYSNHFTKYIYMMTLFIRDANDSKQEPYQNNNFWHGQTIRINLRMSITHL